MGSNLKNGITVLVSNLPQFKQYKRQIEFVYFYSLLICFLLIDKWALKRPLLYWAFISLLYLHNETMSLLHIQGNRSMFLRTAHCLVPVAQHYRHTSFYHR